MELAAPIGECLPASPHPLLSRAECSKILSSARYLWHMSRGQGRPPVRCSRRGSSRCGPPAGRRWRCRSRPPDSSHPVGSPRTEFAQSPVRAEEAPSSPRHPSNKRSESKGSLISDLCAKSEHSKLRGGLNREGSLCSIFSKALS